ncbi:MAG: beta-galactosidase [Actinomycetes bacterium]
MSPVPAHPWLPADTLRVVEVHYYRVPFERWDLMLLRARQSGANGISTYVPWIHHAPTPDVLDLTGETVPERNLVGFVGACEAAGLGVVLKPGPFCDSEMVGGGVPTWLLEAHPDWWAVRHDGDPYRHGDSDDPRLSYDHPDAQAAAAEWLTAMVESVRPFAGRTLWAVQVDNETPGDGMWIHEDGRAPSPIRADLADAGRWQEFLLARYGSAAELNAAWGSDYATVAEVLFPAVWDRPATREALRRWLDLDRYADAQLSSGLRAYASAVRSVLPDVPLFHDWLCMPWRLSGMLVDPTVLAESCEWVGQNVYAEDVDPADMIAGTAWYRMNDAEYVHHAWWRTRLCDALSPAGYPHLVPEISARQSFYLQCSLVGGMDAPCIYMLHSSEPEPEGIGAFQRWAEEAPVLPDGTVLPWWWNLRCLFLCLEAGGADLAAAPLSGRVGVVYDHAGERLARWDGTIPGTNLSHAADLAALAARANSSAAGMHVVSELVRRNVPFRVVVPGRDLPDDLEVVVVPDLSVLSRAAYDALVAQEARRPGTVRLAGAAPELDEDLCLLPVASFGPLDLRALEGDVPQVDGVDVDVRTGPSGRRYVTVVNRSAGHRTTSVEGLEVRCGPASVTWCALDGPVGEPQVVAAMLHGEDAAVGPVRSTQGQVAVAVLDAGTGPVWHVLAEERTRVSLPDAVGAEVCRITLDGRALESGAPVGPDGAVAVVHLDDAGHTDRYLVGPPAAVAAARDTAMAPVGYFWETTLARAEQEAAVLGRSASDVVHLVRRTRSRMAAGSATPQEVADLPALTRIAARMNDIRLWVS